MQIFTNTVFNPFQVQSQALAPQQVSGQSLEAKDTVQFSARLKTDRPSQKRGHSNLKRKAEKTQKEVERRRALNDSVKASLKTLSEKYGFKIKSKATPAIMVQKLRHKIKRAEELRADTLNRLASAEEESLKEQLEDKEASLLEKIGDMRTHRRLVEIRHNIKDTEPEPTFNSVYGMGMDY